MAVLHKKEEKIQAVLGRLPKKYTSEEFVAMFIKLFSKDWGKIKSAYIRQSQDREPGTVINMPKPDLYLIQILTNFLNQSTPVVEKVAIAEAPVQKTAKVAPKTSEPVKPKAPVKSKAKTTSEASESVKIKAPAKSKAKITPEASEPAKVKAPAKKKAVKTEEAPIEVIKKTKPAAKKAPAVKAKVAPKKKVADEEPEPLVAAKKAKPAAKKTAVKKPTTKVS